MSAQHAVTRAVISRSSSAHSISLSRPMKFNVALQVSVCIACPYHPLSYSDEKKLLISKCFSTPDKQMLLKICYQLLVRSIWD
jgi:hypothetical protein